MTNQMLRQARTALRGALLVGAVALISVALQPHLHPALASVPGALELADHALVAPAAVEDEGPYRLIDPVGPGGLTRQAAIGEVLASTMQGGSYGDHQYDSPYIPQIYVPSGGGPHGGYNGGPRSGGSWGGHPR